MILNNCLEFRKTLAIVFFSDKHQPIVVMARRRKYGGTKWQENLQAAKSRPRQDAFWAMPTHPHCKKVWREVRLRSREPTKRPASRWRRKLQLYCRMAMQLQRQKRWQDHWCPSQKNREFMPLGRVHFVLMQDSPGGTGGFAPGLPRKFNTLSKALGEYTVIIDPVAPDNSA
jgi:hypothetical protein